MRSSQHPPPPEEGSGCSSVSVYPLLGCGLCSLKVPRGWGDLGKASARLLSPSASGVQGVYTRLPSHRRICSGPTSGNQLQTAAAGGWCNWETVRHCSSAANPPPRQPLLAIEMWRSSLPSAWDEEGLFPDAAMLRWRDRLLLPTWLYFRGLNEAFCMESLQGLPAQVIGRCGCVAKLRQGCCALVPAFCSVAFRF